MVKIGLTGGIGSGKSTLARLFGQQGAAVYSSDARAKELMLGHELRDRIIGIFGEEAYKESGELNNSHMSLAVFSDKYALKRLEAIVHPAVFEDFNKFAEANRNKNAVVLESAILFESGADKLCDVTVCVEAPLELRIKRTMKRDGATREEVIKRIAAQTCDMERKNLAGYIFNYSTLSEAEKCFGEFFERILKENG